MVAAKDQNIEEMFAPFAARMRDAGLEPLNITTFRHYYEQLVRGNSGMIPEATIEPVTELPDVELPCFTGGQPFRLTDLRGPAVINLWGSWCAPCRDELPVMQRLADRAAGRLHVLGVDVGDTRDAAVSFGAGKQVTMPTLYDRERRLLSALGRVALPLTIFVDAAGRDHVHAGAVDTAELSELVREHTGVTVAP